MHKANFRMVVLTILTMLSVTLTIAQTVITTNFDNHTSSSIITFQFRNNSSTDVVITSIASIPGVTGVQTAELWYSASSLTGFAGAINPGNGWTLAASNPQFNGTANSTSNSPLQTMLSNIYLLVPANTTYRLCLALSSSIRYSVLPEFTPYSFSSGGCSIVTGWNSATNSNIGYAGAKISPNATPRGFIGSVTFIPASPCATPVNPGVILAPTSVCPKTAFSLVASGMTIGAGMNYQWQSAKPGSTNWTTITGATSPGLLVAEGISAPRNYRFVATCGNGGSVAVSNAVSLVLTPFSAPSTVKIGFTGPGSVCVPETIPFFVTTPAASISGLAYQWNRNGSPITGATSLNYIASAPGAYSFTVSNSSGCALTSVAKTVNVKQTPVSTITALGSTTFCGGGSVVIVAQGGPNYTYKWLRDDTVAVSGNPGYTAKVQGKYVLITKLFDCADTSTPVFVTVLPSPAAQVTSNDPVTFCAGGSALLQASPAGSGFTYQWQKGNTPLPGATTGSYVSNVSAGFKVLVTDNNGCSKLSSTLNTKVKQVPVSNITALGATTFPSGQNVTLRASNGTGLTWQWYRNGNVISGATSRDYVATQSGSYTVLVTKSSCSAASAAKMVTVTSAKEEPGIIREAESSVALSAYPNPVNTSLTVAISGLEEIDGTLTVVDLSGKLVATREMKSASESIDLRNQPAGMYLVRYRDVNRTMTLQVVKQ